MISKVNQAKTHFFIYFKSNLLLEKMAIAVFSEYLDNAIVAMGPMSSSSSYNQDDNIAKVETTPPDMKPSVQDFFASFASLER